MRLGPLARRSRVWIAAWMAVLATIGIGGCAPGLHGGAGSVAITADGPDERASPVVATKVKGSRNVQLQGGRADIQAFEP